MHEIDKLATSIMVTAVLVIAVLCFVLGFFVGAWL